jgi:deoxyribodipyrimidine photo-lyase
MWFRRDLRLADNPALLEAAAGGDVVALFVLDDRLRLASGAPRLAFLYRTLRALDEQLDGRLVVRTGDPVDVVPAVAAEVEAASVHIGADAGPYGRRRDAALDLVTTGSPYAVDPGCLLTQAGEPFKVFTPFLRAWRSRRPPDPQPAPANVRWVELPSDGVPPDPPCDASLPDAGEAAAQRAVERFWSEHLDRYDELRNQPGADATSRLSPHLKYGTIHPRQLLTRLGRSRAHDRFRTELAWRDFYADVLWHRPDSARQTLDPRMRAMEIDDGPATDARFEAWATGRTGFPFIDAGMRQLAGEAWVHNRVRMAVASFLVKDLHLDWRRGARFFLQHLVDGDLASNHHGWQWVAGTGTDPAPYFRVFNPVLQGEKFDPDGTYVRRWVPELRGVDARFVHRPWDDPAGAPAGYPPPIVDHAAERREALRRYEDVRAG